MKIHQAIKAAAAGVLAVGLTLTVSASGVINATETACTEIGDNTMLYVQQGTSAGEKPQNTCVVEADPKAYELVIGGAVGSKSFVRDMAPLTRDDASPVAAINGDHFSFKTGIPMGMSISDGIIITSPVPAYNADDYYFHALGITRDGTVLTGENPTLYMQYTVGDHTATVERINRTRENWEGGQICLFTPHYGESTGTNPAGVDFVLRVDEGDVRASSAMKATVVAIDEDGDAPIEEGHVVLSISLLRYDEVEKIALGDQLEFYFSFEQEEWNDVVFAVGGNLTAVENGEVKEFDYSVGAFTAAAPRSALGVKADGTIVLATVDGRSEESAGLTANEMAHYMADDWDCEYALLLDGGGSTAFAVQNDSGVLANVNVPSEDRPVGNGVLLVERASADADNTVLWTVSLTATAVVLIVGGVVVFVLLRRKDGKND